MPVVTQPPFVVGGDGWLEGVIPSMLSWSKCFEYQATGDTRLMIWNQKIETEFQKTKEKSGTQQVGYQYT